MSKNKNFYEVVTSVDEDAEYLVLQYILGGDARYFCILENSLVVSYKLQNILAI